MLEDSFKALSLGKSPVQHKLNRSMSNPDISPRRKITFQELVEPLKDRYFVRREISCEELGVDPDTSSLKFCRRVVSELYVNYTSPEPFCFTNELSTNFSKPDTSEFNMPAVTTQTSSPGIHKRKRRHLSLPKSVLGGLKRQKLFQRSTNSNDSSENSSGKAIRGSAFYNFFRSIFIYSFIVLILLLVGVFAYSKAREFSICHVNFNLSLAESVLKQKVYGQDEGVQNLLKNLKDIYTEAHGTRIFVFTGTTGIGKTYTASILEEVFPWPHNIHHYLMPLDVDELEKPLVSHPTCGDHLLIIDDLKEEDIQMAIQVANYVNSMYGDVRRNIVVFIFKFHQQFSGQSSDDVTAKGQSVVANLTEHGLVSELINFKGLRKEDVIKCISYILSYNWITVNDEFVNMVLEQVDYEREGCKRISSKIALLNDLWTRSV